MTALRNLAGAYLLATGGLIHALHLIAESLCPCDGHQ